MANAYIPHLESIASRDPETGRALAAIKAMFDNIAQQTNSAPVGTNPPPQPHSAVSVKGGSGMADIAMTDESPQYRGVENWFDYSFDNWKTFQTKHVGTANNWRGTLGKGTLHVRTYTGYDTTAPSAYVYHEPVSTHGDAEPVFQANQGSGTGIKGYGEAPFSTPNPPIRG